MSPRAVVVAEELIARLMTAMRGAAAGSEHRVVVGYFNRGGDEPATMRDIEHLLVAVKQVQRGDALAAALPGSCRIEELSPDEATVRRMAVAAFAEMRAMQAEEREARPLLFARSEEPGSHFTVEEMWARIDDAERKLRAVIGDWQEEKAAKEAALAKLRLVATKTEDVWMWEAGGENDPASLSCPIVMSADTLRGLIAPKESAAPLEAYLTDVNIGGDPQRRDGITLRLGLLVTAGITPAEARAWSAKIEQPEARVHLARLTTEENR